MRNFFNNGRRRPSIFEIATAYENGNEGDKKPRTKVVVNTSRLWYGDDSTVSAFIATAIKRMNFFIFFRHTEQMV